MHPPFSIKKILHLTANAPSIFGIWIAPGFCSIGEFRIANGVVNSLAWSETVLFSDNEHLKASLGTIIKKRWLQGKPIALTLSTPEILTTPFENSDQKSIEELDLLPQGVAWDDIDYATKKNGDREIFTCMRQADLEYWIRFFQEIGLIIWTVTPAGETWSRFFSAEGEIRCTLPAGVLHSLYSEGNWQGTFFLPTDESVSPQASCSFSLGVEPSYAWCPQPLLPALEGIIYSLEQPDFNLNLKNNAAITLYKAEKLTSRGIVWGSVAAATVVVLLGVLVGLSSLWRYVVNKHGVMKENSTVSITLMKQENKKLQTKLLGYKSFLSRKSTDAKILHDIGKTATDSIWFSAIKLSSEKDGINTVVEGHSLSESAVATYIVDAEKIAGITKATLEYTEKLSEDKAAKMTNGQLRCELFNFKAVLDFPPRHL